MNSKTISAVLKVLFIAVVALILWGGNYMVSHDGLPQSKQSMAEATAAAEKMTKVLKGESK
jgi:hypothetical protein